MQSRATMWMSILLAVSGVGPGCAGLDQLRTRTDRLEQQIADLHDAQRRLDGRLVEIKISLNALQNQLRQAGGPGHAPDRPATTRTESAKPGRPLTAVADEKPVVLRLDGKAPKSGEGSLRLEPDPPAAGGQPAERGLDGPGVEALFQTGMQLFRGNQLERARDALEAFARRFPEHELAPDAAFFGGQARMQLGDTDQATAAFGELAARYPKSQRAAEALLMVGRCQERLGQAERARSTYLQLVDAYPLSAEASEANRRLSMIR